MPVRPNCASSADDRAGGAGKPAPRRRKRKTARKAQARPRRSLIGRLDLLEPGARPVARASAASAPSPGSARICRRSSRWKSPSGRRRSRSSTSTAVRSRAAATSAAQSLPLKDLPSYVPKAFVAIEDRRFYEHYGVDPFGIARAALANVLHRGVGAGRLDHHAATGEESLSDAGAHDPPQAAGGDAGALAGAQILQDADPRTLSQPRLFRLRRLRHRAGLAALFRQIREAASRSPKPRCSPGWCKSPSRLAPTRNFDGAEKRAQDRARRHGRPGFHQRRRASSVALAQPPRIVAQAGSGSVNYVADWVMDALNDVLGHVDEDIVVRTTIDAGLQASAEKSLADELGAQGRQGRRQPGRAGGDDAGRRGARAGRRPQLRAKASSTARSPPSASPARRSSRSSISPRSNTG